ncbi:response regulator transcription factor [Bacillota bacterium Meth-B3]|nr:response regulator transcription factor [Christensenellaceae bacterium]MEA5065463.1 response regulator transcription factor [Eubacteriales bacterium]
MAERILLVEDEVKLSRFVELELQHEGYEVDKAFDGRTGLNMAEAGGYDLLLLDVMLPGLSGLELLRRVRRHSDVPSILLTARDAVADKVTGLDTGADDYVTKPFEIEELLARIRAALRAHRGTNAAQPSALTAGALSLDAERYTASFAGEPIELTHREFTLLKALMENKGIVLKRETLLEKVWGYSYMGETNVVDVYIRYLRQKIDDKFRVKLIHTVRGVGYVLRED